MIEDAMALLEAQQMALRDQISQRVRAAWCCAVIPGFGSVVACRTRPCRQLRLPRARCTDCRRCDYHTPNHRPRGSGACRRESHRDDDLRITRAKAAAA
jgi:hypothetical protein